MAWIPVDLFTNFKLEFPPKIRKYVMRDCWLPSKGTAHVCQTQLGPIIMYAKTGDPLYTV